MSGNADPTPAPASLAPPRVIPGLSSASAPPTAKPKARKRSSKTAVPTTRTAAPTEGPVLTGTVEEEKGVEVTQLPEVDKEEILEVEEKKTSAVEVVMKRVRAATKKIQRIEGYESSKTPLNADQQRAVAGKPVLEAVIRELNEVLPILKAEEQEDEARNGRNAIVEEKKQAKAIEAALKASKADSQSNLVLLFQFLHLHSLFNPSQASFAPPVLPPVIASATGQDAAAVRMLFDMFANGPLLGGNDDALEKLEKVKGAHEEELLPGVSFARVQQLIHGLTAPAEDVSLDNAVTESQEPARASDSVIALVDGEAEHSTIASPTVATAGAGGFSFLQPSEVDQPPSAPSGPQESPAEVHHNQPEVESLPTQPAEEKVQSWADDIAEEASVPPPSGPATPALESDIGAIGTPNGPSAATPSTEVPPPAPAPAAPAKLDWAADDEDEGLPHLPELAPAVPTVAPTTPAAQAPQQPRQQQQPQQQQDGFQPARPSRRGSFPHGGQGRGSYHNNNGPRGGGNGPRGSFRGGPGGGGRGGRGGFYGNNNQNGGEGRSQFDRGESNASQQGGGEGGFKGGYQGRGRGGGRGGRGRGASQF
ncbi:hypothetical protein JCM11641_005803 [Rhodosporidiobolus odoratus]